MSDKQKFAFDKVNFILLAIGMAIVIIGFLLMTGPTSSETVFVNLKQKNNKKKL